MSLRVIISFVALVLLAVYFAFLNPDPVKVSLTRTLSFEIPMVVFLLSSLLLGVLLTAAFQSILEMQAGWRHFRENQKVRKQEAQFKKWDKRFRKAENAIASGRLPKGLALFEKILTDNPHHRGALYHLGNHLRRQAEYPRAIELHQRVLTTNPEDIQALHSLAEDFAEAGDLDQQIDTLKRCLELDPHSRPTLEKLRQAYLDTDKLEGAYSVQKILLPLIQDPGDLQGEQNRSTRIVYALGAAYMEKGKLDPAVAEFRKAIKENETSSPAYITLGDLYLKLKNPRQAIKVWKNGIEKTGSAECLFRLKTYYDEQGKPEESNKLFRDALGRDHTENKEMLTLLFARRLFSQDQQEEAIERLEQIEGGTLMSRLITIKAYQDAGAPDKAEALIQSAFDLVATAVQLYHCKSCGTEFDSWAGICPNCSAWASLHCGSLTPRTQPVQQDESTPEE